MLFKKRSVDPAAPSVRASTPRGDVGSVVGGGRTVIGSQTLIRGIVKGDGPVVIHGALEGEITLRGALSISQTGRVDAGVEARTVEISGETRGSLIAENRVVLEKTGVFDGELATPVLEVRPGSVLRGRARIAGVQALTRRRLSH